MAIAFRVILPTHIVAGTVALLAGLVAMLAHKGGRAHRRAGKAFFWAMAYVGVSAVALALLRTGPFLMLVGVFSFYLAFTGYRALYHKAGNGRGVAWLDWLGGILGLVGGVGLIVIARFVPGVFPERFVVVAQVFGVLGTFFAASDLYRFVRPSGRPMRWWFLHMQRMLAAYAAALTAFSAVNFRFLPVNVRWLWPTVLAVGGGTVWSQYYRRKFAVAAAGRRARVVVPVGEKADRASSGV